MMHRPVVALGWMAIVLGTAWAVPVIGKEDIDFQVMVIPEGRGNAVAAYWAGTKQATCLTKSHIGCYEIAQGEQAEIRVKLTNGDDACKNAQSWRLKEVVMGGEGDVNDPPPKPPKDGWGNISAQAAKDFNADPDTGAVRASSTDSTIIVQNLNTAAYSIWYKVRVESCEVGPDGSRRIIEYDPRIDNRG